MRSIHICLLAGFTALSLEAGVEQYKQNLQANYMLNYNLLPSKADSLSEIFSEGMVYGRLRANWFFYQHEHEDISREDHNILGLGGSLVYKTAPYAGLSATAGLYYTSASTSLDNQPSEPVYLRSGKDVISRYNAVNGKNSAYAVLAQAYLEYQYGAYNIQAGREVFNSFFTKPNDTKMIPNTFEGITMQSKDLKRTRLRAAYLTRQKLRDHDSFHSIIMYDDRSSVQTGVNQPDWNGNDDSAVHKGLNYSNFQKIGQDENPALLILDGSTRALFTKDLRVNTSVLYLKDLFSTAMLEFNYRFDLGSGYTLTPGMRYVQQFDDGAGKIGGASLTGLAGINAQENAQSSGDQDLIDLTQQVSDSYRDPDSVDASMLGARLILNKGAGSLSLGYTKIADKADFITPWRGFVTSGYTRVMAQYNWIANTETWRVGATYDLGEADIVEGLRTYASFTKEDFDDKKISKADANVYYFGLIKEIKEIKEIPELSCRIRTEYVEQTAADTNDHAELRMELNYLF